MLVFLTSVRHPATSSDFGRVEELLGMSLRSMCSQTDRNFRVVVVCDAEPHVDYEDPRVIYHIVDFPPAGARGPGSAAMLDKGTKLLSGMLLARDLNPHHFALVDADDLVSGRIAEFVNARPERSGWYVDAGYTLDYATWRCQRRHSLVRYCGSTLIPPAAALYELAGAAVGRLDARSTQDRLLAAVPPSFLKHALSEHSYAVQYLANHGVHMRPLPFRAAVWVQGTGENDSRFKGVPSGVPVTPSFCREFGLSTLPDGIGRAALLDRVRERVVGASSRLGSLVDPVPGSAPGAR